MAMRFNPPPGWPPVPEGFAPGPGWQPDPSWPPVPPGWQLWIDDDQPQLGDPAGQHALAQGAAPGWGQGAQAPAWPGATMTQAAAPGAPAPWTPAGYGPGGPYGVPTAPQRGGTTDGVAIAAFIVSLVGGVVIGTILGFLALRRIKRSGRRGRGLAIAGILLSLLWLVVGIAGAAGVIGTASRSASTGRITHKGSLDVFSLRIGDCFDNPSDSSHITSVTAIPCTQPHDAQVYASFTLPGSGYPGESGLSALSRSGCRAREGSIDPAKATGDLRLRYIQPTQGSWDNGDRTVACLIVAPRPTLTGSLLKPGHG